MQNKYIVFLNSCFILQARLNIICYLFSGLKLNIKRNFSKICHKMICELISKFSTEELRISTQTIQYKILLTIGLEI